MTDHSEALVLTCRYRDGRGERTTIEPRSDGDRDVVHKVLTKGGDWRGVGCEIAEQVHFEGALPGTAMLAAPDGGTSLQAIREQLEQALEEDTDTRFHIRQALQLVEAAEEGS